MRVPASVLFLCLFFFKAATIKRMFGGRQNSPEIKILKISRRILIFWFFFNRNRTNLPLNTYQYTLTAGDQYRTPRWVIVAGFEVEEFRTTSWRREREEKRRQEVEEKEMKSSKGSIHTKNFWPQSWLILFLHVLLTWTLDTGGETAITATNHRQKLDLACTMINEAQLFYACIDVISKRASFC